MHNDQFPFWANVLSFASVVVIAPVVEEFVFRGLLLHRWREKWNLKTAAIMSSVIFGVLHADLIGAVAFGLAMCYLYVKSQSLWIPIVCHMLNNLIAWLMELAYIKFDEDYPRYEIADFHADWYIGVSAIVIVMLWTWYYMKKQPKDRTDPNP